jgi:hypothetical protein
MKAYWESGGIAPYILDLGTSGLLHTPWPLYPQGKNPWYPFDRRVGGSQSRSGHCGGEEKDSHPLPGLEPPIFQPVAQRYTIELTQLLCNHKQTVTILASLQLQKDQVSFCRTQDPSGAAI